ncbi:hypothetical protein [Sphingobacterium chuzhouense]|uniref:Uncharacterized protein n=2 Tax=Sphingobacterium chuzhouense TaxID=1742264 RepID=A0ABR7XV28_9SPHI|nr:hypothetical protein [Sphingobacterium chuzhouense]MBD1422910.1 hypothetical protein [Sphingobacterium chuzhouense]
MMSNVQFGTLGGTLCSVWNSFDWSNLLHTVLIAVVGAAVVLFDFLSYAKLINKGVR